MLCVMKNKERVRIKMPNSNIAFITIFVFNKFNINLINLLILIINYLPSNKYVVFSYAFHALAKFGPSYSIEDHIF